MAAWESSLGGFSWICGEEIHIDSFCIQRSILDVLNLLFLFVFCVFLVRNYLRKKLCLEYSRGNRVSGTLSICCALVSIGYLSAGLWDLFAKDEGSRPSNWWIYFIRGLIWICLTVSLLVQRPKWNRIFSSFWWLSFFLLVSTINIEILVRTHNIQILDIMSWLVNFLLLFCAFRNICHPVSQDTRDKNESEPLIPKTPVASLTELDKISFISKLTFSWINPLLCLGYSKPLVLEDIPSLVTEDGAELAYQNFTNVWEKLRRGRSSNNTSNLVLHALARVYLKETVFVGVCAFLKTISVVVSPLLLYAFVNYSNQKGKNWREGLFLVGCLVITKVVESLSQRHWFFVSRRCGMKMRSALMVAVYQKQLRLSSLGRKRHSTGETLNYIAVDAYRMGEFPWWFHSTWSSILQLFIAIGVLFGVVGFGAILGLVPLFISGLVNVPFAKMLQKCQFQIMVAQDQRLRSTSEILNSMKVIKLHSWEEKFKKLIESLRDIEFKLLAETQYMNCYVNLLFWMSPTIVPSLIFLGCALFRSAPLNASTIFTSLAALRSMSQPMATIPEALSALIQVKVSFDRLNAFLLDDESKSETIKVMVPDSDCSVKINSSSFSWDPTSTILTLRDIIMEVKHGQKVAVCGAIGAGKSSLLYAVLGEMPKLSGNVDVFGSVAYVSQSSWIQSGTVRDNILFGRPMDKTKYEKAIKACALDKDIDSFGYGDLTEIGQRGINMSGGQKQRIQLARAVYNDADIYLLDDPFSAVDAHTAAILFNDCVMAALAQKTVILVTHQVEFLSEVDKILVMEGGKITQSGSYEELFTAGTAFEHLVNAHKNAMTVLDLSNKESQEELPKWDQNLPEESHGSHPAEENIEEEISMEGLQVQLTEEEEREIGGVGLKPFWDYLIVSKGSFLLFLCIIAGAGFASLQAASTYWLALAIEMPKVSIGMLIGVYAGLSLLSSVFVYLKSLFGAQLGLKASKAFFAGFTNTIFKAPMLFFDCTPVGRILTRASSDLNVLDFNIPTSIVHVVVSVLELVAAIGVMASITWPVLIVAVFAIVAINYVQGYYLASAREMTRISGTSKSPIVNYAAETSLGVVTIRAFGMVDRFFQNYLKLIDMDAKLFFYSNAAMEWLIFRIEALQNLTLVTAALLLVLLPEGYVAPGQVGLSLSYALALTGSQVFLSRKYCSLSNYFISVERIKQFMHIPSEPSATVEEIRPPPSWPSYGRIDFHNLEIKYRPNAPAVLKGITCTFKEGTRVGVVGRTGSGKTTLMSALFRLVEPESGKILIDGFDICSIGLKDLRMKLSIIPQEAALFKGSIRTNLDPLGLYSDHEIWEALEKCQLKATISRLPNLLDSSVSDEGENWSAGQRQLFCLGRVLLKRNRILVLDEATASMDSATDAILQRIIRQEFSNCTVITVAHRVPTVIDSNMVMVLSYGKLVEYDEPSTLMKTNSSFSKLVAEYWSSCRRNSYRNFNHHRQ